MEYLNRQELVNKAKQLGIRGYSKLKKADLISVINNVNGVSAPQDTQSVEQPVEPSVGQSVEHPELPVTHSEDQKNNILTMSLSDMKQLAKERGLKGYSKANKTRLVEMLS